jgi:hypothetical protein
LEWLRPRGRPIGTRTRTQRGNLCFELVQALIRASAGAQSPDWNHENEEGNPQNDENTKAFHASG